MIVTCDMPPAQERTGRHSGSPATAQRLALRKDLGLLRIELLFREDTAGLELVELLDLRRFGVCVRCSCGGSSWSRSRSERQFDLLGLDDRLGCGRAWWHSLGQ